MTPTLKLTAILFLVAANRAGAGGTVSSERLRNEVDRARDAASFKVMKIVSLEQNE